MNMHVPGGQQIIKIAIMAVGGQGGGVVTDWIVDLAESNGWYAQATSVPGVAQRTGATIYYIEMVPDQGVTPILALMPSPGDVDIVIAAELMEAGRAMMRGLVTPERTTLIASSHRAYAVSEKAAFGSGIADGGEVLASAAKTARRFIHADLEKVAVANGSVISASLFGALAAAAALPFSRDEFEATIRKGGRGIEASLSAFRQGFDAALEDAPSSVLSAPSPARTPSGSGRLRSSFEQLSARLAQIVPSSAQDMARRGLEKVVEFQDLSYGEEYLDRIARIVALDKKYGVESKSYALTENAAKYLANAMAYDDVIRVARIKTDADRFARVSAEVQVKPDQILKITEFMHPRAEEVCAMLPAKFGRWVEGKPKLFKTLDRLVNRGRKVRTDGIFWFSALYLIGGMRRFRRRLLRHEVEQKHIVAWLDNVERVVPHNYDLAVEILRCQRLIKGYSDTHARGATRYSLVMSAVSGLERRDDGADWLRRLRESALKDEDGTALKGALKTVASL
jgi:indolepyruvate ferredoxin oxidoreductase beta subunit